MAQEAADLALPLLSSALGAQVAEIAGALLQVQLQEGSEKAGADACAMVDTLAVGCSHDLVRPTAMLH